MKGVIIVNTLSKNWLILAHAAFENGLLPGAGLFYGATQKKEISVETRMVSTSRSGEYINWLQIPSPSGDP